MKRVLITCSIFLLSILVLCFIPFNIDKFIPNITQKIQSEYGISINTNHLKFQIGPYLIIKSPQVNLANNKEKFASLQGIKIKVDILSILKGNLKIKDIRIDDAKFIIKLDKDGKPILLNQLSELQNLNKISKIRLKHYNFDIIDIKQQPYSFIGQEFVISDFIPTKHIKISTSGKLKINSINHIDYDISIVCDGLNFSNNKQIDIIDFLSQIQEKKATANIVADLKLKNINNNSLKTDGSLSIEKMTFVGDGKKLPYSSVAFTFLGNKTTVASTIYTNSTDKININGYFTNSNNPNFNISVKSNQINLRDLLYFARLFSDISNLEQIKDINGTLYSDFTLKGSLKRLKSNGVFKIKDASLSTDQIKIEKLNSDIDFTDNKILIRTAKAFINNAPVKITGDVTSNKFNLNCIVDKFKLKNISYKGVKITDGLINIDTNISGEYNNLIAKINANLTNLSGNYHAIKFRLNNTILKMQNTNNGNIVIYNTFIQTPKTNSISIPVLKVTFDNSDININPYKVYSGNTRLDMYGKVSNYNTQDLQFNLNGGGYINPKGILNINELDNVYPIFIEIFGDKNNQYLNFQGLETNSTAKLSFEQPIIMNCSLKKGGNELKILDCSINTYKGLFSENLKKNIASSLKVCVLTGSIENLKHPELKNIKLNFLKTCTLNLYHYVAKINGNLAINGPILAPEIVGNIKFPILSDKYGCLTAKNITLALTKNIINFDSPSVKIFDSIMNIVGTAEAKFKNNVNIKNINIKSKDMDLDNISLMLLMLKETSVNLSIENGNLYSESLNIQTPIECLKVSDLNSTYTLKNNNQLDINNISANMYNGKILGNIKLNIDSLNYTGLIQGRGLSAGPVMQAVTNLKENICGKLDFDMNLQSSLKAKFIKDADIKFIIRDGQMSILGKIEHLLYAQNIIADHMLKTSFAVIGRAISAKDTGLFKYLNGIIAVNKDNVTIKSMKMLGPNMSLYITGNYSLISNIANLNILGRLSNSIVSSLGAFGTFTMDKFKIALSGEQGEVYKILQTGVENIPQLPQRNTKEFKAYISGPAEAPSSVKSFLWISETEKEYRTREIQHSNIAIPKFIEELP